MNTKYLILFRTLFKEMRTLLPMPPEHGVKLDNMSQWMVLAFLVENDDKEITQKDIEKAIHRSRATVSGILDTLEKKGMITRSISKKDKRKKIIQLYPKVLKSCQSARESFRAAEKILIQDIPNEDLEVFDSVIEKMIENCKKEKCNV